MSANDDAFDIVIATPEALRDRMVQAYTHAVAIMKNGKRVRVLIEEAHDPIRALQRNFLHGPVLGQISEQARVGPKRERFTIDAWKALFWKQFVKPKFGMRKLPGYRRPVPYRINDSSEKLGVRAYAEWTDQIIDFAVAELGVEFIFEPKEREAVRYINRPRRRRAEEEEA